MMGDTGPCGPCSELHVDLTPQGDTKGALVNKGTAECIEIWNLVFIQFNANPDGTFSPLPAKHVDTGMGFERVTSIMQGTKGFSPAIRTGIMSCVVFCVVQSSTDARSVFTNRFSTSWWMCSLKRWARCFPKFANASSM